MPYYIYKTTNTTNGKYYIGVTNGHNKWYRGSGTALKRALKKYGGESFTTEMLESFETEDEAFLREAQVVNEGVVGDPLCYNMKLGGRGGRGSKKSEEHKKKISDGVKERLKTHPATGRNGGRKPAMPPEVTLSVFHEHGYVNGAEMLGLSYEVFKHRVRRLIK